MSCLLRAIRGCNPHRRGEPKARRLKTTIATLVTHDAFTANTSSPVGYNITFASQIVCRMLSRGREGGRLLVPILRALIDCITSCLIAVILS